MSQFTLELPESLEHHLQELAAQHGVSLQQYILEVLATQIPSDYTVEPRSEEDVSHQRDEFAKLLQQLGQASFQEIEGVLAERRAVEPEPSLSPEVVRVLKQHLSRKQGAE
jgi:hypothetical protein